MNAEISVKDIENQISTDIEACNTLLLLLDKEQEALRARDTEALAKVIQDKVPALAQLEESVKKRVLWANISLTDKASGKWDNFVAGFNRDELKKRWQQLKELTLQCQQKNEINGKILSRQQQIYGRLVGLLRGQTSSPNLYNASGSATASRPSIKVDEA